MPTGKKEAVLQTEWNPEMEELLSAVEEHVISPEEAPPQIDAGTKPDDTPSIGNSNTAGQTEAKPPPDAAATYKDPDPDAKSPDFTQTEEETTV